MSTTPAMTQTSSNPLKHAMNQLTIYDSMTAQKRLFVPIQQGIIDMYVCGMTVYDYCHIGHARVMVAFDVIVRWLRQLGYQVNYVRNITDIDDKIIARALENGESLQSLTTRFIQAMHEDEQQLGCASPNLEPKATDYIDDMQQIINTLVQNDYAYPADNGDVYYAVEQFADYGKLSGRRLADLQAGARVEVENHKKNPFDFVLWKSAKPDEPQWSSPWGNGRPGWHIECSAMSTKCLGNTFDIHGGGHDLQFPHHENEIAQSEACTGEQYARNWMHVGFINVDGEKMSKSLGNFFTIREVIDQYHPETVRFFLLSSHYRSQINFSDTALNEAHQSLSRLYQALKSAEQFLAEQSICIDDINANQTEQAEKIEQVYASDFGQAFIKAMNDDFNTASAISVLFAVAKELNKAIKDNDSTQTKACALQLKILAQALNLLQRSPQAFLQASIGADSQQQGLTDEQIEQKIEERANAKADKNYAKADEIRAYLKEQGIELEDSRQGTTWRRS